jgi:hypothetical protein
MKRNYFLFRIALLLAVGSVVRLPGSAWAQDVVIVGTYNGFSQSTGDPNVRGPAELMIISQTGNEWTGLLTILDNTYSVRGEVDADGTLDFTSGRTRGVTGTGQWQDLTRGGALIQASYKLSSGDQGEVDFVRNFTQPPDPGPPDISGSWSGTFENILSLVSGTVEWIVQQDRTPNGAPGTGFMGQETIDTVPYDFVGTIDGQGNFVRIGGWSGSAGSIKNRPFIGGGKVESGQLTATTVRHAADGLLLDVITASKL